MLVCRFQEVTHKAFYDFYPEETINIPYRETDLSLVTRALRYDPNVLCGDLVAMDTNFAGEQGYFTIILSFIKAENTKEYTVHFYPVGTRYTIK
ncbi:hypothetical protein BM607_001030 [Shewanella sp. SACH]|nr:hypothetical protein BM607_001030 [Shewanella sp. SACH]